MNRLDCGESLAKKYFAGKICMARYVSGAKNIYGIGSWKTLIFCNPHFYVKLQLNVSIVGLSSTQQQISLFFFAAIEWLCNNLEWPAKAKASSSICWYSHNRNGFGVKAKKKKISDDSFFHYWQSL